MRVALAQVLVRRPDHLLLDEPTNHLDAAARTWLVGHLQAYKGTVLIVSHETDFLDATVQRIIDLRDGEARSYPGNHSDYRRQRAALLAQQRSTADRQQREIARQTRFIDRFRSTATKAKQVQSRIKALDKIERVSAPNAERAVHFRIQTAGRPERAVLTVQDLSHAYDDHIVLVGANLEIERGEKVALVGPNGGGKSTLLRALAGHIAPTEGSIAWAERAEFGYYDQHQDEALDPSRTVLEEVASIAGDHTDGDLRSVLGRFLFRGEDVFKRISVLSGGERSRVALAKFLIQPSNVLLLDEPTNHLDGATRARLIKALADYDGTIICASHDRENPASGGDPRRADRGGRVPAAAGLARRRGARRLSTAAGGRDDVPGGGAATIAVRGGRGPGRREKSGMVGERGFEPPTSSSRTKRAAGLRHSPTPTQRRRACRARTIARGRRRGTALSR